MYYAFNPAPFFDYYKFHSCKIFPYISRGRWGATVIFLNLMGCLLDKQKTLIPEIHSGTYKVLHTHTKVCILLIMQTNPAPAYYNNK